MELRTRRARNWAERHARRVLVDRVLLVLSLTGAAAFAFYAGTT